MTLDEVRSIGPRTLLWDAGLLEYARVKEIRHRLNWLSEWDLEWSDGSVSTIGIKDLLELELVSLPDRSDPEAVARWLASDGPGAP